MQAARGITGGHVGTAASGGHPQPAEVSYRTAVTGVLDLCSSPDTPLGPLQENDMPFCCCCRCLHASRSLAVQFAAAWMCKQSCGHDCSDWMTPAGKGCPLGCCAEASQQTCRTSLSRFTASAAPHGIGFTVVIHACDSCSFTSLLNESRHC